MGSSLHHMHFHIWIHYHVHDSVTSITWTGTTLTNITLISHLDVVRASMSEWLTIGLNCQPSLHPWHLQNVFAFALPKRQILSLTHVWIRPSTCSKCGLNATSEPKLHSTFSFEILPLLCESAQASLLEESPCVPANAILDHPTAGEPTNVWEGPFEVSWGAHLSHSSL